MLNCPPRLLTQRCARISAFSLLELLVSMAVLALLVVMVGALLSSATSVATQATNHLDADGQARQVFDRMALDFAKLVKRPDVDFYFQKHSNGNDQMAFYSESTGYFPSGVTGDAAKSNVSLVGYRVFQHKLERLAKSLIWNGVAVGSPGVSTIASSDSPMVYLPQTLVGRWPNIADAGNDPDYQIIGEQVYRLEFCYLVKNDAIAAKLSDQAWLAPNTGYNGLKDVVAIVVGLGILDSQSRQIVTDAQLNTAEISLADSEGATITAPPIQAWQSAIKSGSVGLPRGAGSQVRVYQRSFYLNPTR